MAFAPPFQRPFSSPFDRRAAVGVNWSQWFDHLWIAKGAASKAASLLDLVGAQSLSEIGTVTWASAGWSGFSTANTLNTSLIPDSDWTLIARGSGGTTADNWCMIGSLSNILAGVSLLAGTGKRFWYGTTATLISGNYTAGVLAIAANTGYVDGSSAGTVGNAWNTTNLRNMYIGARNRNDVSIDAPWPGTIQAVGIKKATLSAAQVAAATAEFAAL